MIFDYYVNYMFMVKCSCQYLHKISLPTAQFMHGRCPSTKFSAQFIFTILTSVKILQIGFVGTVGTEFSGDIALDDIRVRTGRC